jgi:hypothetical protein
MKPDMPTLIANPATAAIENQRTRDAIGPTGLLGPLSTTRQFVLYLGHLDDLARRRAKAVQQAS